MKQLSESFACLKQSDLNNSDDKQQCHHILKQEIQKLSAEKLQLYGATQMGGIVDENSLTVTIHRIQRADQMINVKFGVFFVEVVGGCNCHDDPVAYNGYCDLLLEINLSEHQCHLKLIDDL